MREPTAVRPEAVIYGDGDIIVTTGCVTVGSQSIPIGAVVCASVHYTPAPVFGLVAWPALAGVVLLITWAAWSAGSLVQAVLLAVVALFLWLGARAHERSKPVYRLVVETVTGPEVMLYSHAYEPSGEISIAVNDAVRRMAADTP